MWHIAEVAMGRAYRQPGKHHAQQPGSYAGGGFNGTLHSTIIIPRRLPSVAALLPDHGQTEQNRKAGRWIMLWWQGGHYSMKQKPRSRVNCKKAKTVLRLP